jgi:hypothetical protein
LKNDQLAAMAMTKQPHGPPMTLGNMRVITEALEDDFRNLMERPYNLSNCVGQERK